MAGPLMIDLTKQVAERARIVSAVKEEALKLVGGLPDEASWEDLIYQLYVRKKIERGIEAADQGRVLPHEEVKKQFLSE
jgi:predicted transcriptional regulator